MRYAIFSARHANLEALEAVLAKIDELAQEETIEQIWFLGDLVGYGPDPNECILKLRERTDVIIVGNHDWAAVGKIDLEDFSAAARISAEWTAEQLTEEHRAFLTNLPERLEIGECTLVHGSPYGPLWEYLTSEVLAERSFQYFSSRYCLVGHTHVPVIFQQPDTFSNAPTLPLQSDEPAIALPQSNGVEHHANGNDEETAKMVAVQPATQQSTLSAKVGGSTEGAFKDPESGQIVVEDEANTILEEEVIQTPDEASPGVEAVEDVMEGADEPASTASEVSSAENQSATIPVQDGDASIPEDATDLNMEDIATSDSENATGEKTDGARTMEIPPDEDTTLQIDTLPSEDTAQGVDIPIDSEQTDDDDFMISDDADQRAGETTPEPITAGTDDQLSGEIEELLTLLGLSQSMIQVTNEMIASPEGHWEAPDGYRAIINPGGVGQPRDGDPRAAFMIYDTERGFEFYRVPYPFEKTQEKIIKAGLPHYLAVRLEYGR